MKEINNITIIGSGNVGTHLAEKLFSSGYVIDCVFGLRKESGTFLAKKTSSKYISKKEKIPTNSDLYLVALKDDLYLELLSDINLKEKLVIHTSGSIKSEQFEEITHRWGCLYPLQSINKNQKVNWKNVKFFIEAAEKQDEIALAKLCKKLKFNFNKANSAKRRKLHIAAVTANNFTYHLLSTVRAYCEENELDFNDLKHLQEQSLENAYKKEIFQLQTGPAKRKDLKLINKHLTSLEKDNNLKEIYELFTQQILNQHHHEL